MTDTLKDFSMLRSIQHVMGACMKISVPSKLSWKSINIILLHVCLWTNAWSWAFKKVNFVSSLLMDSCMLHYSFLHFKADIYKLVRGKKSEKSHYWLWLQSVMTSQTSYLIEFREICFYNSKFKKSVRVAFDIYAINVWVCVCFCS